VEAAHRVATTAGMHGQVDERLLHRRRLTGISLLPQAGAPCTARLAAAGAVLALPGLSMADNIGVWTVRAVPHLDDPCASSSSGGIDHSTSTPVKHLPLLF
jgi:hypothetical protein